MLRQYSKLLLESFNKFAKEYPISEEANNTLNKVINELELMTTSDRFDYFGQFDKQFKAKLTNSDNKEISTLTSYFHNAFLKDSEYADLRNMAEKISLYSRAKAVFTGIVKLNDACTDVEGIYLMKTFNRHNEQTGKLLSTYYALPRGKKPKEDGSVSGEEYPTKITGDDFIGIAIEYEFTGEENKAISDMPIDRVYRVDEHKKLEMLSSFEDFKSQELPILPRSAMYFDVYDTKQSETLEGFRTGKNGYRHQTNGHDVMLKSYLGVGHNDHGEYELNRKFYRGFTVELDKDDKICLRFRSRSLNVGQSGVKDDIISNNEWIETVQEKVDALSGKIKQQSNTKPSPIEPNELFYQKLQESSSAPSTGIKP